MLSWTEFIDNLKGDVQDKSKNPFFGAFLVTWIIRHWEVVFIILNFDSYSTLDIKLGRLNNYFKELPKGDFWITILFSFGVIILGYLLLNLARIISNFSEKIVTPIIYKWTVGKVSIVLREDFDIVLLREVKLKEKLERERKEKNELENQIDELETIIKNLSNKKETDQNNNEIEGEKLDKLIDKEYINGQIINTNKAYEKLRKIKKVYDFKSISGKILAGISLAKYDSDVLLFLSNRLIKFSSQDKSRAGDYGNFELTDLGNKVLDQMNYEEDNTI